MIEKNLSPDLATRLADLYRRMAEAYDAVAAELDFTCDGCPDNCCDSFFLHHTMVEWAYLWEGLNALDPADLDKIKARTDSYLAQCTKSMVKGERPQVMCPLIENGLCGLYEHRLMICRMHGVPSSFNRPDGQKVDFPGCFRCQELTGSRNDLPEVDRTELYRELAELERQLLTVSGKPRPRIKMTIAEMISSGPPKL
jgi:Fe-S-cluster containining protein